LFFTVKVQRNAKKTLQGPNRGGFCQPAEDGGLARRGNMRGFFASTGKKTLTFS
jgi:hypothetical protein